MTVQHTHTPLLAARHVGAEHDGKQVLHGVDLDVGPGEIVSLLGRNGVGKTTALRSVIGLTPPAGGSIRFAGREIGGLPAYAVAHRGVA